MTDFSSVDRLMEFGLGMGLAQQMINTMNYSVGNMTVPGVNACCTQKLPVAYYAVIDNAQAGPLNEDEIIVLIQRGKINRETLMWTANCEGWCQAESMPYINKLLVLNCDE